MTNIVYKFSRGQLNVVPDSTGTLRVADSWLVNQGRVRDIDRHFDRFAGSCLSWAADNPSEVRSFCPLVSSTLPRRGLWFPRIELR
ncbi:MAG: aminotransferase, partial [Myxococcota bacterium]